MVPMTLALKIAYLTGKMAKVVRHFREKFKTTARWDCILIPEDVLLLPPKQMISENKGKASKDDQYLMINTIFSSNKYFSDVLD